MDCTFCKALRPNPWTKEYDSKLAYKAEHGCDPWAVGAGTRRIQRDEALMHTEMFCPSAWAYYNALASKTPDLACTAEPIEADELARRLLADSKVA